MEVFRKCIDYLLSNRVDKYDIDTDKYELSINNVKFNYIYPFQSEWMKEMIEAKLAVQNYDKDFTHLAEELYELSTYDSICSTGYSSSKDGEEVSIRFKKSGRKEYSFYERGNAKPLRDFIEKISTYAGR